MNQSKTLAFGKGENERSKPGKLRRLAFSSLAAATVLTSCAHPADAITRKDSYIRLDTYQVPVFPSMQLPTPVCMPELAGILRQGEKVKGSICRGDKEFVLTDRSLLIISRNLHALADTEEIALKYKYTRTDMQRILARGLVDWEASDDNVFFLTRDSKLTIIPAGNMGSLIPTYTMPFDTRGMTCDSMIYFSGYLFMAPVSGEGIAMSFSASDGNRVKLLDLRSNAPNAGFYVENKKLVFGKKGVDEIEIKIEGEEISPIKR